MNGAANGMKRGEPRGLVGKKGVGKRREQGEEGVGSWGPGAIMVEDRGGEQAGGGKKWGRVTS